MFHLWFWRINIRDYDPPVNFCAPSLVETHQVIQILIPGVRFYFDQNKQTSQSVEEKKNRRAEASEGKITLIHAMIINSFFLLQLDKSMLSK